MKLPPQFPQYSLLTTYVVWLVAVWGHGFGHSCPSTCDRCGLKTDLFAGITAAGGSPSSDPAEDHHRHDADRCLICQSIRVPVTTTSSVTVSSVFMLRGIDIGIPPNEPINGVDLSTVLIRGPPAAVTL